MQQIYSYIMKSIFEFNDCVDYLIYRHKYARAKNPKISLRAWALKLKISPPSVLSRILLRQRPMTISLANKISKALELNTQESSYFEILAKASKTKDKMFFEKYIKLAQINNEIPTTLNAAEFQCFSSWFTGPLLQLISKKPLHRDDIFLKFKGRIKYEEFSSVLQNLELLGYIKVENYFVKKAEQQASTLSLSSKMKNEAVNNYLRGQLNCSFHALENLNVQDRKITATTINISKSNLPIARSIIDQTCKKLLELNNAKSSDVYQMNIQFFPIFD